MGCGELCCKSISGIFTFIFTLLSLAIMGFSAFVVYFIVVTTSSQTMSKYFVSVPAIVCFVLAAILFIAIIMACCAMCMNSICCLDTYSIILILLAVGNIAIGAYSLVTFKFNNSNLEFAVAADVLQAYVAPYGERMDNIQTLASCCGTSGPRSYEDHSLPKSCCSGSVTVCTRDSTAVHKQGCAEALFQDIVVFNFILGWAGIIIGIAELLATIASFYLSCALWRDRSYSDW